MGNLPKARIEPVRPFLRSGVDFAGPLKVRNSLRRGSATSKAYLCLFVCLGTKALHLELVEDLTTRSFLAALRRFIARRGKPLVVYSDNATNFMGARNELRELAELWKNEQHILRVTECLAPDNIEWKFIPPRSPHFGGIWEANLKQVKLLMKRILGDCVLSFNEMQTVLIQIEACLNSRPLMPLSVDVEDLNALTPAHFLIGGSLTEPPEPDLTPLPRHHLKRWDFVQQLLQRFWKRWASEYLQELQKRHKWTKNSSELQTDMLVLIKNEHALPQTWTLGRVTEVHPGPDGKVRVATLRTATGLMKRSARALAPLPMIEDTASRGGVWTSINSCESSSSAVSQEMPLVSVCSFSN